MVILGTVQNYTMWFIQTLMDGYDFVHFIDHYYFEIYLISLSISYHDPTKWYNQQHFRLYKTVKLHQYILNLINFSTEHRFDWEYLTVLTCHAVVRTSCCDTCFHHVVIKIRKLI
jgi:hypothetical protein